MDVRVDEAGGDETPVSVEFGLRIPGERSRWRHPDARQRVIDHRSRADRPDPAGEDRAVDNRDVIGLTTFQAGVSNDEIVLHHVAAYPTDMMTRHILSIGILTTSAALAGCGPSSESPDPAANGNGNSGTTAVMPNQAARDAARNGTQSGTGTPALTPAPGDPAAGPGDDPSLARFGRYVAPKPATWQWKPPLMRMRAANYVVPAPSGGNQADLVIFTPIQGTIQMNIDRFKNQFRSADQTEVEPIVTEFEVSGMPVTLIELKGEYKKMGEGFFTKDQMFLNAILQAEEGNYYLRLTGDAETVERHRDAFMTLINGIRIAEEDTNS